jgi:hypothetical protein
MVAQMLAVVIGLGSGALYLAAFFFPEVHRRHDFFWSGVGFLYALVLWCCAAQISATELLGHGASTALLGWLGWQTLSLRRKRTPIALQTPLAADAWSSLQQRSLDTILGWLRVTPLGRWLPAPKSSATRSPLQPESLRASALKDIGYEFLDDLDPEEMQRTGTPMVILPPDPVPPVPEITKASSPQTVAVSGSPPKSPGSTTVPASRPAPPLSKPRGWLGKGQVVMGWLGDMVKSRRQPKPKRSVIDIPPRPSPLAKNSSVGGDSSSASQPPKLDRENGDAAIAIIDTAVVDSSQEEIAPSPGPTAESAGGDVSPFPESSPESADAPPAIAPDPEEDASNWPD